MPRRRRFGWMVCRSDPLERKDRTFYLASTEEEARAMVRALNAAGPADAGRPLFWCEWWSTSSDMSLVNVDEPETAENRS